MGFFVSAILLFLIYKGFVAASAIVSGTTNYESSQNANSSTRRNPRGDYYDNNRENFESDMRLTIERSRSYY